MATTNRKEKNMTKSELITTVAEKTKANKSTVSDIIEMTIEAIVEADRVTFKGFGTFEWVTRPARKGRNPYTNTEMDIPESRALKFKPSPGLKGL